MYIVKLTVKPSNPNNSRVWYKKVYYEGLFLPEDSGKKVRHEKIKNKVETELVANLRKRNPELQIDYTLTIEYNAVDFVLKEDEPSPAMF